MSYLSDEQIKILLVSKESPTICDTVMENDSDGRSLDQLIKSSSDFDHFSLYLTFGVSSLSIDAMDIIKFELGKKGLHELHSRFRKLAKEFELEAATDKYELEERCNYPEEDVLGSNTPDEDKYDWNYD